MSQFALQTRITLISWVAAVVAGAIVGCSFLYLYWPANNGELFVSLGTAIAVMVVLRRVVASELEKRHESE